MTLGRSFYFLEGPDLGPPIYILSPLTIFPPLRLTKVVQGGPLSASPGPEVHTAWSLGDLRPCPPLAIHAHPAGPGLFHALVPCAREPPGALSQGRGEPLPCNLARSPGYQATGREPAVRARPFPTLGESLPLGWGLFCPRLQGYEPPSEGFNPHPGFGAASVLREENSNSSPQALGDRMVSGWCWDLQCGLAYVHWADECMSRVQSPVSLSSPTCNPSLELSSGW